MSLESNADSARRSRARQRARLMAQDPARISDALLTKIIFDDSRLSDEEEDQLAKELEAAKQELYRRRGGPDRELQLAHDYGEIYE